MAGQPLHMLTHSLCPHKRRRVLPNCTTLFKTSRPSLRPASSSILNLGQKQLSRRQHLVNSVWKDRGTIWSRTTWFTEGQVHWQHCGYREARVSHSRSNYFKSNHVNKDGRLIGACRGVCIESIGGIQRICLVMCRSPHLRHFHCAFGFLWIALYIPNNNHECTLQALDFLNFFGIGINYNKRITCIETLTKQRRQSNVNRSSLQGMRTPPRVHLFQLSPTENPEKLS